MTNLFERILLSMFLFGIATFIVSASLFLVLMLIQTTREFINEVINERENKIIKRRLKIWTNLKK